MNGLEDLKPKESAEWPAADVRTPCLDPAKFEVVNTSQSSTVCMTEFVVCACHSLLAFLPPLFTRQQNIKLGETNRFLLPGLFLLQHRVPTARSWLRSALMLRSDPWLSSASPSSHYLHIPTAVHRDDDGGAHLSRRTRDVGGSLYSQRRRRFSSS